MVKTGMFNWKWLFATVAVVAMGVGSAGVIWAQKPPIKIGVLYSLTGVYSFPSKHGIQGVKLAFDEINNEIAGRKIELLIEDDAAPDVAVGLTKARKLVEKDKVNVLMGIIWSPTGVAVAKYATEQKVPLVLSEAAPRELTQENRSPFVFRTSFAAGQTTYPGGKYYCRNMSYKKLVVIGFDSVFGRQLGDYVENGCKESGGAVIEKIYAPVGTPDFAPYLAKIQALNPDAVYAVWAGSAAIRFLQQYKEYGLKEKYPLLGFGSLSSDEVLKEAGDAALGVVTDYFYSASLDNPENKRFVQEYTRKYGEGPAVYSDGGYSAARAIREALVAVNGEVENQEKFLTALRKVRWQDPRGPLRFDPYQQSIINVYILRVQKVGDHLGNVPIETLKDVEQYWPKGKPR